MRERDKEKKNERERERGDWIQLSIGRSIPATTASHQSSSSTHIMIMSYGDRRRSNYWQHKQAYTGNSKRRQ